MHGPLSGRHALHAPSTRHPDRDPDGAAAGHRARRRGPRHRSSAWVCSRRSPSPISTPLRIRAIATATGLGSRERRRRPDRSRRRVRRPVRVEGRRSRAWHPRRRPRCARTWASDRRPSRTGRRRHRPRSIPGTSPTSSSTTAPIAVPVGRSTTSPSVDPRGTAVRTGRVRGVPHADATDRRRRGGRPVEPDLPPVHGPAVARHGPRPGRWAARRRASGSEWRTAPLWGLGRRVEVTGRQAFLHDGRARTPTEAILWHGGEAARARERFERLSASDRAALVDFLAFLELASDRGSTDTACVLPSFSS